MRVEIEARYPNWLAEQSPSSGYEPDDEIIARAIRVAARPRSIAIPARNVLVVSHGGVINALERDAGERWRQLDEPRGTLVRVRPTRPPATAPRSATGSTSSPPTPVAAETDVRYA